MNNTDTIVALATAPGRGSVGIIRLSGPKAKTIGETLIQKKLQPRYAHYGPFLYSDPTTNKPNIIDEGICLFFPNPHSFTGEDVVEFQGHGGPVVMDQLLKACLASGARMAEPGEFSQRAYLNDKMDLTQAEAIADLINATSEQAAKSAINSLQGAFSEKIDKLVNQLTHLRMYVEAAIDFPEEEVDFLSDGKVQLDLQKIYQQLENVLQQAKQGALISDGMKVVIAGKPNAGKSSLLNALAGRESAIVTDIEGTTRDVLKESIHLDGMPLEIIDTAGLRHSHDQVEQIGIERAWQEIQGADRILLLIDSSNDLSIDHALKEFYEEHSHKTWDIHKVTIVANKIDQSQQIAESVDLIFQNVSLPVIYLSAKTSEGLEGLVQHLQKVMGYENTNESSFTARRRHIEALLSTQHYLQLAREQLATGAGELVAEELTQAQHALGEITGKVSADELLGHIFSSFCIGK